MRPELSIALAVILILALLALTSGGMMMFVYGNRYIHGGVYL